MTGIVTPEKALVATLKPQMAALFPETVKIQAFGEASLLFQSNDGGNTLFPCVLAADGMNAEFAGPNDNYAGTWYVRFPSASNIKDDRMSFGSETAYRRQSNGVLVMWGQRKKLKLLPNELADQLTHALMRSDNLTGYDSAYSTARVTLGASQHDIFAVWQQEFPGLVPALSAESLLVRVEFALSYVLRPSCLPAVCAQPVQLC